MEIIKEEVVEKVEKAESVFLNRNFNLLFIGSIVSRLGDALFNFAMGWYVLELTKSAFLAGLYVAIGMISYLLLQIIGGIIADRFNKVKLVYSTDFLRGLALTICFIGLILARDIKVFSYVLSETTVKIGILYLSSFLLSILGAIFSPAASALMPKIVKENQYQQAQSLSSLTFNLTNIIGTFLGGFFYFLIGPYLIFIYNAISYILSGISEMFIKVEEESKKEKLDYKQFKNSAKQDFKEGFHFIKKDNSIKSLMLFAVVINFFTLPIFMIYPQFLFNIVLKTSTIYLSIAQGAFSAAALISALALSFLKQPNKVFKYIASGIISSVFITFIVLSLFYFIVERDMNLFIFIVLFSSTMFMIGIVNTIINIPLNVVMMKRIDKQYFGRVSAIFGTFVGVCNPLSILIFGFLVDNIGLINSMIISVGGGVLSIFYLVTSKPLRDI